MELRVVYPPRRPAVFSCSEAMRVPGINDSERSAAVISLLTATDKVFMANTYWNDSRPEPRNDVTKVNHYPGIHVRINDKLLNLRVNSIIERI